MPPRQQQPSPLWYGLGFVFKLLLKTLWSATVVVVPALGVWLASSLAAYRNGPVWLVCLCGALLFPALPLLWDALTSWRRRRDPARAKRPRVLTFWDRLVLRTLTINLLFLFALSARFPSESFAALSTRGDWFLDGRDGPRVEQLRRALFSAAGGLEWLYEAVRDDPYKPLLDEDAGEDAIDDPRPDPRPAPDATTEPGDEPRPEPDAPDEPPRDPDALPPWPLPEQLHPLVVDMPAEVETSIERVARYIADNEPVQWRRIKALHDYVADRVAYDAPALVAGRYPPQDAETVFTTHLAVCAGYAQLLAALGEAAGERIVVVSGDARVDGTAVTGEPHAWNAARVGEFWYLIDATWDAGHVKGATYTKEYETSYLFTPPAVFGVSHYPEEERWQLREDPVSRGEFFRQPMMRARFYAEGLELVAPERSQVSVASRFEAVIRNPRERYFLVTATRKGGGAGRDCEVERGATTRLRCELPDAGTYTVSVFVAPEQFTTYRGVGELEVNASGA